MKPASVLILCNCSSLTAIVFMCFLQFSVSLTQLLFALRRPNHTAKLKRENRAEKQFFAMGPISNAFEPGRSSEDRHLACLGRRAPCPSIGAIAANWKHLGR